jgi:alpha-1,2-mannosyltransferase
MIDYHNTFYPAGQAILSHQGPYRASLHAYSSGLPNGSYFYPYPPVFAMLVAPLSALPYETAAPVWYALNVCLVMLTAGALSHILTSRSYRLWGAGIVAVALVGFAPLRETLLYGQFDVLVLFSTAVGVVCAELGDRLRAHSSAYPIVAGVCLGLATMLKLYPGGLVLFYAWKRQWRLTGAALATIGALAALSAFVAGPQVLADYWRTTTIVSGPPWLTVPQSFSLTAFVYRSFGATQQVTPLLVLPPLVIRCCIAAWILLLGVVAAWLIDRRYRADGYIELALVAMVTLLALPILERNHLCMLLAVLPSLLIAINTRLAPYSTSPSRRWAIVCLLLTPEVLLPWLFWTLHPADSVQLLLSLCGIAATLLALIYLLPSHIGASARASLFVLAGTYVVLALPDNVSGPQMFLLLSISAVALATLLKTLPQSPEAVRA